MGHDDVFIYMILRFHDIQLSSNLSVPSNTIWRELKEIVKGVSRSEANESSKQIHSVAIYTFFV